MFERKPRRFNNNRRRQNGRGHSSHSNGHMQSRMRSNSFSNSQPRNNFRQTLSAEKLFEKYSSLAKEAMSSGDKTSSENYLQHADHFLRVIDDKNRSRIQSKENVANNLKEETKLPNSINEKEEIHPPEEKK
jgi:hypothetical protein